MYPDPSNAAHALDIALDIRRSADWPALERFCIEALRRFPRDYELRWQLSHCYWMRHDSVSAEAVMREAASHHPDNAAVTGAIAMYLSEQSRYGEAEAMYRAALAQSPDDSELAADLAQVELRRNAWSDGWRRFERRRSARGENSVVAHLEGIAPRWGGQPLDGKRVVVYSELGLGDDIQFVRYFPQFAEGVRRNGGEARLAVRSTLYPLIRRFAPDCIALETGDFGAVDYTVRMMSMPVAIGLLPHHVDGRAYLDAAPERIESWRRMLASDGTEALRVGLVWAGSPAHRRDAQRSVPVEALAPLWRLPDVAFYPVAPGREGDIAAMRSAGARIAEMPDYHEHFHDSAALVCALDVLVTVDSSPLHLAGALGKPVLAMIDRASHWCWGEDEAQPWYDSVQLIRQRAPGDWAPVVERVAAALSARLIDRAAREDQHASAAVSLG
ncbi:TPR repeat-containing protein [Caballeronia fortuita]|uniref:TPR repeat-containing protein n=1 Tax=Caballeronia fortuita TaxID=1777138 RepID=A0A158DER9_9BURK|nr:tetratricopeptide repeat protein [Caballeronia fortuita]SAK93094.1 TPR repeat-containing protein [Caballeronia fortuita]